MRTLTRVKILHVVGARPNFMKIAPIIVQLRKKPDVTQILVHTGQHYDTKMSDVFFQDLGMPAPDVHLGVGSLSHAQMIAKVISGIEPVLLERKPDIVVVAGDVNSTVAVAMVAARLGIGVAHVEAGLRSRDWAMPEEQNRILTDDLSDLLFTPSRDGDENLKAEGITEGIHFVGNVMIDSLNAALPRAKESNIHSRLELVPKGYALATLHRPSNVDEPSALARVLSALSEIGRDLPVVFPIHPRTKARIPAGFDASGIKLIDPLGYLDFLALTAGAKLVMTDSGGIQEETTALSVPCLTMRENTERPVTVEVGTNQLVGTDPSKVVPAAREVIAGRAKKGKLPELWDGRAAERIADVLVKFGEGLR